MPDDGGVERRNYVPRRSSDERFAVLERITAQHHQWFTEMHVGEASEREREATIHIWRWWVRGEDQRKERRKLIAALVAASAIIGPFIGSLTTEIINKVLR